MKLYLEKLIEKRIIDLVHEVNRSDYATKEQEEEMKELLFFRENIFKLDMIKEEGLKGLNHKEYATNE